jgi:DNA-binding response OmpR family regulator
MSRREYEDRPICPAEKDVLRFLKSYGPGVVVFRDEILDHMARGRSDRVWKKMLLVYISRLRRAGHAIEHVRGYKLTSRR